MLHAAVTATDEYILPAEAAQGAANGLYYRGVAGAYSPQATRVSMGVPH